MRLLRLPQYIYRSLARPEDCAGSLQPGPLNPVTYPAPLKPQPETLNVPKPLTLSPKPNLKAPEQSICARHLLCKLEVVLRYFPQGLLKDSGLWFGV